MASLFSGSGVPSKNLVSNGVSTVVVHKHSGIDLEPSAQIVLEDGNLEIGTKWSKADEFHTLLRMGGGAKLTVKGYYRIYTGSRIYVNENAHLQLGTKGYLNHNANISCFKEITIGDHTVISEGVTIRDSDNHTLEVPGFEMVKPVHIGSHVWIGLNVTILKGVTIGDGAVVAAGAVVTKDVAPRTLVGGVPAKVLREDVDWKR